MVFQQKLAQRVRITNLLAIFMIKWLQGDAKMATLYERALGSLLGSFVGDAFGAQTEFKREKDILKQFPSGILEMDACKRSVGSFGEITDDSEMAIMMLQSILSHGSYSQSMVRKAYQRWRNAGPEDIGITICGALDGRMNPNSQANGALMRITPLGILGCKLSIPQLMQLSDLDCSITHSNPVSRDCNRLFVIALSLAICKGWSAGEVYSYLLECAPSYVAETEVLAALKKAKDAPPEGIDGSLKGWVLIAFQLAFYTVLHAESFEQGMVEVTMRAGDADTNAAIYGALAGAFASVEGIPLRWRKALTLTDCIKRLFVSDEQSLASLAEIWTKALLELNTQSQFN